MTAAMFDVDQVAIDQAVLAAEQRKCDLIEQAVRRFAPHMAAYPDVKVIHLYSTNASLRKEIRALCGGKTICVEHVVTASQRKNVHEIEEGSVLSLPKEADMVVTKSAVNSRVEWLAARIARSNIAVLPEATDYLMARLDKQRVLTLVGADQAK